MGSRLVWVLCRVYVSVIIGLSSQLGHIEGVCKSEEAVT